MDHADFEIGKAFYTTNGWKWICTDKGSRTIIAIHDEEGRNPSWLKGPPYAVAEVVFDENDMPACSQEP
jgi:hypothetical protein